MYGLDDDLLPVVRDALQRRLALFCHLCSGGTISSLRRVTFLFVSDTTFVNVSTAARRSAISLP